MANNIVGTTDPDILKGTGKNDRIFGDLADDELYGRKGNDKLKGGGGADYLNGGPGIDWADYSDSGSAVTVDLAAGTGSGGTAAGDTLANIENLRGSEHDDFLYGDKNANKIKGEDGNDVIKGGGGADKLVGGNDNDILLGMGGEDILKGNDGNDLLSGGNKADKLVGGNGNDDLTGGKGHDLMIGGSGGDTFAFVDKLSAAKNVDTIKDFAPNLDKIGLFDEIFTAIGPTLDAGEFRTGKNAKDADDYILYNKNNGGLFYDADGNGGGNKVKFAQLDTGLSLDSGDFIILT